ncbi:hypothetical protein SFSGTM_07290 [Sulfuriferula nivalis]|uniref:Uncharacterized protein n=1 Tax=Sulfuriferula nivalis TaxID=2675298 RepID=A0A809RMK0_9PROT|nr:hypothetical protein SFSGTM_07290 [Sulfuriferula nivalis]
MRLRRHSQLRPQSRYRHNEQEQISKAIEKSGVIEKIAKWLTILTIPTLFLTLLGYGHELTFLDQFGLHPEDLQSTPLDFLMRSWRPLSYVLINFNKIFTVDNFWKWLASSWITMFWILWSLPLISAIGAWLYTNKKKRYVQAPIQLIQGTRNIFTTHWQQYWHNAPARGWGYAGWLGFPLFLISIAGTWLTFYLGVAFLILSIAYIPMWGFASGKEQAEKEVLSSSACLKLPLVKNSQDADRQARCLLVMQNNKELARGYLIEYSADRVFLYRPCDKHQISVPLRNAVVEQVNTLGFAMPVKDCKPK